MNHGERHQTCILYIGATPDPLNLQWGGGVAPARLRTWHCMKHAFIALVNTLHPLKSRHLTGSGSAHTGTEKGKNTVNFTFLYKLKAKVYRPQYTRIIVFHHQLVHIIRISLVPRPSFSLSFAVTMLEAGKKELVNSCLQNCYCKRKHERRQELTNSFFPASNIVTAKENEREGLGTRLHKAHVTIYSCVNCSLEAMGCKGHAMHCTHRQTCHTPLDNED